MTGAGCKTQKKKPPPTSFQSQTAARGTGPGGEMSDRWVQGRREEGRK